MATIEIKVPSPGESVTEVEVSQWLKSDGDYVTADEVIAEIDTDKATMSIVAEKSGKLGIKVSEGEAVKVGAVLCTIDTSVKAPASTAKPSAQAVKKAGPAKRNADVVTAAAPASRVREPETNAPEADAGSSPVAGRMMKANKIKPASVKGTGQGGRITKSDVLATMQGQEEGDVFPGRDGSRTERREKMSTLRRKVSERLVAAKKETAMLTTFNEVDMSAIIRIRKKYKDTFKEHFGVGLGYMSFFIKAVSEALRSFPAINARIDGQEIVYHDFCDVGIAVSAPKGLMVPVIRNAESLSMAEIEAQVLTLAKKAREGKISIGEMTGGTFTITNGGVFGSMLSTPIINPPQSAILGMHNIVDRPVAIDGRVVVRPVMYVALSYDHRIIDGRESVSFLVKARELLENPVTMLLHGGDPEKRLLGL